MTDDDADPLALDRRDGLPGSLRALLEAHPREEWTRHVRYQGLTRFWLERHAMFRRGAGLLIDDAEALAGGVAPPIDIGGRLVRIGGLVVNELLGHHRIEDAHYFPALAQREPALARGFELLDRDHALLDAELERLVETLNTLIALCRDPAGGTGAAARHAERLRGFETLLDRHLADEEDLVVPVILRHGEP